MIKKQEKVNKNADNTKKRARMLNYNKYYLAFKIIIPKAILNKTIELCKEDENFNLPDSEVELTIFCILFEIMRTLKDDMFVKISGLGTFSFFKRDVILKDIITKRVKIVEDIKYFKLKISKNIDKILFKSLNSRNIYYRQYIKEKNNKRKQIIADMRKKLEQNRYEY